MKKRTNKRWFRFGIGIILFNAFIFYGHTSSAQNITTSVDKASILIGEPFHLHIATIAATGHTSFNIDTLPHFDILERAKPDTQTTAKGIIVTQTLTLTSWDSGRQIIPALHYQNGTSKPLLISVTWSPMDTAQPYHDIKDIIPVAVKLQTPWYVYAGGAAILVLLAFLLIWLIRRSPKENKPVSTHRGSAYQVAMKRLSQLNTAGDAKVFYTGLVDLFRDYLFQRKGMAAHSETSEGLITQLKSLSLTEAQQEQAAHHLRVSDSVKFARYQPGTEEKKQSLEVIRSALSLLEQKN